MSWWILRWCLRWTMSMSRRICMEDCTEIVLSGTIMYWIKILAEVQILFGSKACSMKKKLFKEKTVLDHQTTEIVTDLGDTIFHVLPKILFDSLCQKWSRARTFFDSGNPDKIAYALCLLNAASQLATIQEKNFHWFRKWQKKRALGWEIWNSSQRRKFTFLQWDDPGNCSIMWLNNILTLVTISWFK